MSSIKARYWPIILLVAAFILGGFLHVALYGNKAAAGISQIYYGAVVVIWAMSIQRRIIQNKVRAFLLVMASMLLLYFVFQLERYSLVRDNIFLRRNLWYWYYVPMILVPLFFFIISRCIYSTEEKIICPSNVVLMVVGALLCLGFVTNDFHQGSFSFDDMLNPDNSYGYGPIYVAFIIYMFFLYSASLINIIRKNQLMSIKRLSWLPVLISVCGVIGVVVGESTSVFSVNNIKIWNLAEWYSFIVMWILENCIIIGLIPSNTGYMSLIQKMSIPVELREKSGRKILASASELPANKHIQVNTFPILGGEITWVLDMTKIYELNERLKAATEQLQNRNNYLQTENNTKEEQETLNSRNRVYDKMTEIVLPQIIKVESLLDEDLPEKIDENLLQVAVLNTYIKRRCNMELMKEDMNRLPLSELKLAMNESAAYLQLCDIKTVIVGSDEGLYPADEIIGAYEHFEMFIEKHMSSISSVMVTVMSSADGVAIRIMADDEPADEFCARKEEMR